MSGNREGGKRAAATTKMRYGADFYRSTGRVGGEMKTAGGFGSKLPNKNGLTGSEQAKVSGSKGGISTEQRRRARLTAEAPSATVKPKRFSLLKGIIRGRG